MQPVDPYFTSGYKRKAKASAAVAARHRVSWPAGSQFTAQVHLEMRGGERPDWWHFLSVPANQAEDELSQWRDGNPGFEFRMQSGAVSVK